MKCQHLREESKTTEKKVATLRSFDELLSPYTSVFHVRNCLGRCAPIASEGTSAFKHDQGCVSMYTC